MRVEPRDLALSADFLRFLKLTRRVGVAVSGGSDSMALMHLVTQAAREAGSEIHVATVDHQLREGSAGECEFVASVCAGLGVSHTTLRWENWDSQGNLQAEARAARHRLLAEWANTHDIHPVVLGHTADDQSETLIMRLSRGAGVDGLTGMAEQTKWHGVSFMRPVLHLRRADLRSYLDEIGQEWRDDPSNEDAGYHRVRIRQQMAVLEDLGLTPDALAMVAENMRNAKAVLDRDLRANAERLVTMWAGDVLINTAGFIDLTFEQARRLLAAVFQYLSGREFAPRRAEQIKVLQAVRQGKQATVSGCLVVPEEERVRFCREYQAVGSMVTKINAVWDGRWRVEGPHAPGLELRALGETGLRQCPEWRDSGLPRASLSAAPAVWDGETLIAAPLAGNSNGWTARIVTDFHDWLLSH